jgi:hypothetical protein
MTVGGVDTYFDYDERKWKSRRLGGPPIPTGPVCPVPRQGSAEEAAGEGRDCPMGLPGTRGRSSDELGGTAMSATPVPPVPPVVPGSDPDDPEIISRPGDDSPLQQPVPEPDPDEDPDEQLPRG